MESQSPASSVKYDSKHEELAPTPSPGLDETSERSMYKKLDLRILPLITLLYLLAFLDRTNIGNARVAGLAKDLHLVGLQYNVAVAIFFIPYTLFEVPCNLILKRFVRKPSTWIASIMAAWGIVMVSMAFVKSYHGLLAARFFLGVPEAGLLPGATFYLSQWYPRDILATRLALFISASTLAGAFGGILAFAIQHMEGLRGLHGWSWIFLLEGLATIVGAILAYFLLPGYPETTDILTETERVYLTQKLRESNARASNDFHWKYVRIALSDYKSYLYAILFFTVVVPAYCFALFVPSIILGLGFEAAQAQAMSTPPFVFTCVLTFIVGYYSDRLKSRGPFICAISLLGIIGYTMLLTTTSPAVGYVAAFFASTVYCNIAMCITWAASNTPGDLKRAVVLAMVLCIGNLGGFPASFIFRAQDAPRYHPGHATCVGCICATFFLAAFTSWDARRLNRLSKERVKEASVDEDGGPGDSYVYMP